MTHTLGLVTNLWVGLFGEVGAGGRLMGTKICRKLLFCFLPHPTALLCPRPLIACLPVNHHPYTLLRPLL